MCTKILFIICTLLSISVDTTLIDQRQSGDLNVQVDLKGLHIIALMKGGKEEYVDYDYAYDYSEMTIKPQNRTTPRPSNITGMTDKIDAVEGNTTTLAFETTTQLTLPSETVGVTVNQQVNNDSAATKSTATYNVTEVPTIFQNTTADTTSSTNFNNTTGTSTPCKKGFVLNSKGDCEIKLQGAGNALLKLVKLSQKLKLRRENKSESSDTE